MDSPKKKFIIIDTNALMHRAFHALPPLTTAKGKMVNAIYGFTSVFLKMISDLEPDYIVCAFDVAAPTFRKEKFKEYKAHRVKAPQEFYDQIPDIKRVIEAFNIPILEKPGFEADDIIGTLSDKFSAEKDIEIIIVTGDLDTLQLINGAAKVYTLKKGIMDTVVYGKKEVMDRYGLEPRHMADYKGLRGDPSDNIPGVPGIGEKTAAKIIQKFHSLENLYGAFGEKTADQIKKESDNLIKGRVYENLRDFKEQAFFSRELATIRRDVPVEDFVLAKAKWSVFDKEKVISLFKEFEFWSLVNRMREFSAEKGKGDKKLRNDELRDKNLPSGKCGEVKLSNIADFASMLRKQKEFAVKLTQSADLFGGGDKNFSIAFYKNGEIRDFLVSGNLAGRIKDILEDKAIKKIGYGIKSDLKLFWDSGINFNGAAFDVMVASYLVSAGQRDYSMEKLIFSETGQDIIVAKNNIAGLVFYLKNIYEKKLAEVGMEKLFYEMEMPLIGILAKMEKIGIRIDKDFLAKISAKVEKKLERIADEIYGIAGEKFNINSPQQLSAVLFQKLKISANGIGRTIKGRSTAASELAKIAGKHKIIDYIIEYRELAKLKNTYLDTLPSLVSAKDDRLHTNFNQTITVTGRLSSSDPNLQNIPVKTELGSLIREAFVADEGYELVSFDYSQIELRIAAALARDEKMIEIFKHNGDIHTATAATINQVEENAVTEEMRRNAKALNFGIIYGISVYGLAKSAGIGYEEAKDFIDSYMAKFYGIARYVAESVDKAKRTGYAETLLGRRRYLPDLKSSNTQVCQAAERMAINMPIQGMAADMVKLAMIGVGDLINSDVRLLLQVHDELLFEIKSEKVKLFIPKIKNIMENVYQLDVPIRVDIKIGKNWGDMKNLDI